MFSSFFFFSATVFPPILSPPKMIFISLKLLAFIGTFVHGLLKKKETAILSILLLPLEVFKALADKVTFDGGVAHR
jgi:hypothetical protein